jgi:uncharacterized protein (TIGR02246 family)
MMTADARSSEIRSVTKAWVDGFNIRDASALAALYDLESVLWGTLSPEIISTPQGVRRYFDAVCASPMVLKVVFDEQLIRACDDAMINSGSYTFSFVRDGQQQSLAARFSMTLRKREDRWLIVDHHSSAKPVVPKSP